MTTSHLPVIREAGSGSGRLCRAILAELPTWFGVPASVEQYVETAESSPTVIASMGKRDVAFLTTIDHSPYASEVAVMGVLPEFHRMGIGRALLTRAERSLAARGVENLQVKTLSARSSDEGYARTRAFYVAYGFRPLEEFPDLWSPENPALQMIKVVQG